MSVHSLPAPPRHSEIAPTAAAPSRDTAWEYLEDIRSALWTPYSVSICRQLDAAMSCGAVKCQVTDPLLPPNQQSLEIDFAAMIETNVVTGWRRKIRVHPVPPPPPLPISVPVADDEDEDDGEWQWHSDKRGWTPYHSKLSRKMERAFTEGLSRYVFKIRSTGTQYEVDFASMTQRNLDSLKLRNIRRRLPLLRHPPSIEMEMGMEMEMEIERDTQRPSRPKAPCLDLPPPPPPPPPLTAPALKEMAMDRRRGHRPQRSANAAVLAPWTRAVGSNPFAPSTASRDLVDSMDGVLWEHRLGGGRWRRYDAAIAAEIERVFRSDGEHSVGVKVGGVSFEIALRDRPMMAVNLVTGTRSEVRRVKAAAAASTRSASRSLPKPKGSLHRKRASAMAVPVGSRQRTKGRGHALKRSGKRHVSRTKSMVYQPGAGGLSLLDAADLDHCRREREHFEMSQVTASNDSVDGKVSRKRREPKGRSLTVDLSANGLPDDVLQRVVRRQQDAMSYFKRRHSKRRSMALSMSMVDAVQEEDEEEKASASHIAADHKKAIDDVVDDGQNATKWRWKNEDGEWRTYSVSNCGLIETAWRNEVESVEITKEDVVYEVRPRQLVECHFATNRMRPIERVQCDRSVDPSDSADSADSVHSEEAECAEHDPFDALSNPLEFGDDDDLKLQQEPASVPAAVAAECGHQSEDCPVEAILHEIESLIEDKEGPDGAVMAMKVKVAEEEEVEGSTHCEQTEVAVPTGSDGVVDIMDISGGLSSVLTAVAAIRCVHCNETVKVEDRLAVNGTVLHRGCFVCSECGVNLVDRSYLELAEGTAGTVRLCQDCVSRRFLKLPRHSVTVPNS